MDKDLAIPNNAFRTSFVLKCKAAVAEARAAGALEHPGIKGAVREILVGKMIEPILTPEVKIGTGQLVSYTGEISPQVDVVLYNPSIMPRVVFDAALGLFPVESVLYSLEVKSILSKQLLKKSISDAREIRKLTMLAAEHIRYTGNPQDPVQILRAGTPHPINALFAFQSDLAGNPSGELARYRELDPDADVSPAIQVICIAGRGYWYAKKPAGWMYHPAMADAGEIMAFLGGTANTLPQLTFAKGRPRFGMYLGDGQNMVDA
jgi:hypothetical protein